MYSKNNNYNILPSNFYFYKREIVSIQGRSHDIFLKGGVTLCESEGTHRIVVSFSPPVAGCLLKKGIQRGGGVTGKLQDPPSYGPGSGVETVPQYKRALTYIFVIHGYLISI